LEQQITSLQALAREQRAELAILRVGMLDMSNAMTEGPPAQLVALEDPETALLRVEIADMSKAMTQGFAHIA
ncbi:MAG: hypothetical protein Q9190_008027, partial [Brigantiaea leucoxantha]